MSKKLFCFALCAMLFSLCFPAQAQQPTNIPRIGYLEAVSPSISAVRSEAFRQGLRELGYVEGKNIVTEYRYAEGKRDRLPALAAELVLGPPINGFQISSFDLLLVITGYTKGKSTI